MSAHADAAPSPAGGGARVPVVIIAFNRPDVTRRLLDALRPSAPSEVFLVCDGPRTDRPDDAASTAAVRDLLDGPLGPGGADWPATVHRRYSEVNLGCEANVELGLDWVFERVASAVVLEDDCLPDPTFLRFAADLLDHYADDDRVWQIAGHALGIERRFFGGASYAHTTWAPVWGWATWAAAWREHRAIFPRDHRPPAAGGTGEAPVRTVPFAVAPDALVTPGGRRHFAEAATSTDVVTHGWDKQWWLSMMTRGAFALTPATNLVENAGFGAGATHTVVEGVDYGPVVPATFPLRHPDRVALSVDVERELELVLNRVGGRAARIGRRLVRSPRLRRLLRAAAASRAATALARLVARARSTRRTPPASE